MKLHTFIFAAAFLPLLHAETVLTIGKTAVPPVVDGKAADVCWKNTLPVMGFTYPGNMLYAKEQTVLRFVRDEKKLYGLIEARLPKGQSLTAGTARKNDVDIWQGDCVELLFVGKNGVRHYMVNGIGSSYEAFSTLDEAYRWRAQSTKDGWSALAVKSYPGGWTAEFAVPLSALPEGELKLNVVRDRPSGRGSSSWARLERVNWWDFENAARVQFADTVGGFSLDTLPDLGKKSTVTMTPSGLKADQIRFILDGNPVKSTVKDGKIIYAYESRPAAPGSKIAPSLSLEVVEKGKTLYRFGYAIPTGYVRLKPCNLQGDTLFLDCNLGLEGTVSWESRHNYPDGDAGCGGRVRKRTEIIFEVPEGITCAKGEKIGTATRNGEKYNIFRQVEAFAYNSSHWVVSRFTAKLPEGTAGTIYYRVSTEDSMQDESSFSFKVIKVPGAVPPKRFITGHYSAWATDMKGPMNWRKTGANTVSHRGYSDQQAKLARELKKAGFYIRRGDYFWPGWVQHGGRPWDVWTEKDRSARARDISGFYITKDNGFLLSPTYRGKFFVESLKKEVDFCKKAGITWMAFDIEGYVQKNAERGDFSVRTVTGFKQNWLKKYPNDQYIEPQIFERDVKKYPVHHQRWVEYKCEQWAGMLGDMKEAFRQAFKGTDEGTAPIPGVVFSDWNLGNPWTLEAQNKHSRNGSYFKVFDYMESDVYSSLDREIREIDYEAKMFAKTFPGVPLHRIMTPCPRRLAGYYATTAPPVANESKYAFMEAIGRGFKGVVTWDKTMITLDYLRQFAEGVNLVTKVEDIVLDGTRLKLTSSYPEDLEVTDYFYGKKQTWKNQSRVFVNGMKLGDRAVISVGEYREQKPIQVTVNYPADKSLQVIDLETSEKVAVLSKGDKGFTVTLPADRRCRLFLIKP